MIRHMISIVLVAAIVALGAPSRITGQEDPATSCDVKKAGLDPAKFYVYLTKDTPYTAWPVWPGTERMAPVPGPSPHGSFHTTHVNPAALRSLQEGRGMAFGSLIVLESFGADRKLVGLSAKLKIKDYHPEAGDWHWFHYDARGNVLSCGRTPVCIGCHEGRREDDFLLTRMVK